MIWENIPFTNDLGQTWLLAILQQKSQVGQKPTLSLVNETLKRIIHINTAIFCRKNVRSFTIFLQKKHKKKQLPQHTFVKL